MTSLTDSSTAVIRPAGRLVQGLRRIMTLVVVSTGVAAMAPSAFCAEPGVAIRKAAQEVFIDGDCNNPAVWVNGELRVYGSPYPQNGYMGGVRTYKSGANLLELTGGGGVTPDRSVLGTYSPPAFGPWFESVVADEAGHLWAYYHAEFPTENKIHPRIGAQVSRDGGETWTDLGIVLDTPSGTDEVNSSLGYGFIGGNGDFSVILDPKREFLYFFFSQYGGPDENQGVAVARMRWSERASPSGNVQKLFEGEWREPGVGGKTTPFLRNVGDAHGKRAGFDYWWGPSIHWNTHLQRYVILLNRSNTPNFAFQDGVANWFMTGASLEDPSSWDAPRPLPFPDDYRGSWYPQVIGSAVGETDQLAGRTARLFVHGFSMWEIQFLRPEEMEPQQPDSPKPPRAVEFFISARPELQIRVGDGLSDTAVEIGGNLEITASASDADGDMFSHWLEIRNPAGQWSWQGWLLDEPWAGLLQGDGFKSVKRATFTFVEAGTYVIRTSAIDSAGVWIVSSEVNVRVGHAGSPNVQVSVNGRADNLHVLRGSSMPVLARAVDPSGEIKEHWLEILAPDGIWSWQRGSTESAWSGVLVGNAEDSIKAVDVVFDQLGTYLVRTSASVNGIDWVSSAVLSVDVHE